MKRLIFPLLMLLGALTLAGVLIYQNQVIEENRRVIRLLMATQGCDWNPPQNQRWQ